MQLLKRYPARAAAAAFGLALLAVACTDQKSPVGPGEPPTPGPGGPGAPSTIQAISCTGSTKSLQITCAAAEPDGNGNFMLLGNQNVNVTLASSNANYNAGLGRLTFDVTVRNRIGQPLGTTDGTTLDPTGVRVFFHQGPTVTSGSGVITVVSDGTDVFLGASQPYYQYNEVLSEFELSPVKQWRLDMPNTVETFSFLLYVSAPVQYPNGWISFDPAVFSMPAMEVKDVGIRVRDRFGRLDSLNAPSVVPADPALAVVGPVTYVPGTGSFRASVFGVRSGTVAVNATGTGPVPAAPGASSFTIGGIQRLWRGTADTNYNNAANWRARIGIPIPPFVNPTVLQGVPTDVDTAVVNGDSATQMSVMAQNNTVGGVILQPGAVAPTIDIGSFDYSLTSSIDHGSDAVPNPGRILGTGRMIFTGTAKTISGGTSNVDYRNARFTGTYSLDANLNVTGGRIVVQGGRLRNQGHRIRVRPN